MSGLDIFTWIVVLILVATVGIVFAVLGMMPGKVAQQRRHPQVEAIQIASWLALIFGFALWPVVMVWAYLKPIARPVSGGSEAEGGGSGAPAADAPAADAPAASARIAESRITELEARIAELEAAAEGGAAS